MKFELANVRAQVVWFCWIHMAVYFTALQMYFIVYTVRHGLIWYHQRRCFYNNIFH